MKSWLWKLATKGKKGKTISSVPPSVGKTEKQRLLSEVNIATHKLKGRMAKLESDVFHGTRNIPKKLDKMKTPKKTKHYYTPKDF